MRRGLPLRIAIVAGVILGSLLFLYPPGPLHGYLYGRHDGRPETAPPVGRGFLPRTLNLGLDLQGGIHLVLGVDLDKALEAQVERAATSVRASLEKKGVSARIQRRGVTELVIELPSPQTWAAAQTAFSELGQFESKEADQAAGRVVLALRPREATSLRELAVRQALETIRNRVDQFGVAEPSIVQQLSLIHI